MSVFNQNMQIKSSEIHRVCPEHDLLESVLSLDGNNILELGCGAAFLTRLISKSGQNRQIIAAEVDKIQHEKNLLIDDLPNVTFIEAGAQELPLDDNSVDTVFMFKSLHHVPVTLMPNALSEIRRVLKSDGLAYISEPIYAGDFNQIIKLFNDEKMVRTQAFEAIRDAVDSGAFKLHKEMFFYSPVVFESFEEFENRILGATHTNFNIDDELFHKVKRTFLSYTKDNNGKFLAPNRVDILKPL
ncbi:MAG: class I SAM-dependent methyltransferase [Gammaproteobacteria bacterium]|nr:class I SAM-dependent methyltransferase [Gammaproteobacteria bacterium]